MIECVAASCNSKVVIEANMRRQRCVGLSGAR
jgi:hypothetical protein